MPRNFIQKCFNTWIETNSGRFNYPPCDIRYKQGGIEFNLLGIIPELKWTLHANGCGLYVDYRNHPCWDIISSCEVEEIKTVNGLYYCGYCAGMDDTIKSGRKMMLYSTRIALWQTECFELLLSNSDRCLQADTCLCIFGDHKGCSTAARLYPKKKADKILASFISSPK